MVGRAGCQAGQVDRHRHRADAAADGDVRGRQPVRGVEPVLHRAPAWRGRAGRSCPVTCAVVGVTAWAGPVTAAAAGNRVVLRRTTTFWPVVSMTSTSGRPSGSTSATATARACVPAGASSGASQRAAAGAAQEATWLEPTPSNIDATTSSRPSPSRSASSTSVGFRKLRGVDAGAPKEPAPRPAATSTRAGALPMETRSSRPSPVTSPTAIAVPPTACGIAAAKLPLPWLRLRKPPAVPMRCRSTSPSPVTSPVATAETALTAVSVVTTGNDPVPSPWRTRLWLAVPSATTMSPSPSLSMSAIARPLGSPAPSGRGGHAEAGSVAAQGVDVCGRAGVDDRDVDEGVGVEPAHRQGVERRRAAGRHVERRGERRRAGAREDADATIPAGDARGPGRPSRVRSTAARSRAGAPVGTVPAGWNASGPASAGGAARRQPTSASRGTRMRVTVPPVRRYPRPRCRASPTRRRRAPCSGWSRPSLSTPACPARRWPATSASTCAWSAAASPDCGPRSSSPPARPTSASRSSRPRSAAPGPPGATAAGPWAGTTRPRPCWSASARSRPAGSCWRPRPRSGASARSPPSTASTATTGAPGPCGPRRPRPSWAPGAARWRRAMRSGSAPASPS